MSLRWLIPSLHITTQNTNHEYNCTCHFLLANCRTFAWVGIYRIIWRTLAKEKRKRRWIELHIKISRTWRHQQVGGISINIDEQHIKEYGLRIAIWPLANGKSYVGLHPIMASCVKYDTFLLLLSRNLNNALLNPLVYPPTMHKHSCLDIIHICPSLLDGHPTLEILVF